MQWPREWRMRGENAPSLPCGAIAAWDMLLMGCLDDQGSTRSRAGAPLVPWCRHLLSPTHSTPPKAASAQNPVPMCLSLPVGKRSHGNRFLGASGLTNEGGRAEKAPSFHSQDHLLIVWRVGFGRICQAVFMSVCIFSTHTESLTLHDSNSFNALYLCQFWSELCMHVEFEILSDLEGYLIFAVETYH